jgi:hypothetical protein
VARPRGISGAGHGARIGEMKKYIQNFQSENLQGRDHFEVLSVSGRIILKTILKKYNVRVWTVLILNPEGNFLSD